MIRMECPSCGAKLRGPDDAVGKTTRCPQCGTAVTIPEPVFDAELIDPGPPPPVAEPRITPEAGPSPEARRPCPVCGELIVATAAKCRFCGEIFDPSLRKTKRGQGVNDEMGTSDWLIVILCPMVGCIFGLIWMIQGRSKGGKVLGLSILFGVLWNVLSVVLQAVVNQN